MDRIGCYDEHLSCWRPQSDSIFDELRRYFIGSSTELDDLSAIAIPHMHQYDKVRDPEKEFKFETFSCRIRNHSVDLVFERYQRVKFIFGCMLFFNPSRSYMSLVSIHVI